MAIHLRNCADEENPTTRHRRHNQPCSSASGGSTSDGSGEAVQDLKGNSSKWLNETSQGFAWQSGYGAFSVSESRRQAVIDYIGGQEEHHRKWSFEQEFLTLLRNSKIEFDPKYIFA